MKKSTMIIFIVALLVLGGIGLAIANMGEDKAPATTNTQDQNTNTTQPADTSNIPTDGGDGEGDGETSVVAATITYGNDGFSPSSVTVKVGETVKVTNSSSSALDFESDPHPVHTDDPELNAGSIASGSSKTFKLTTKGTWGFHNHENDSHEGTIIVQ